MHLKFERRTMLMIAATPVILCVFLMFMLIPDRVISSNGATAPTAQQTTTPR
jgi:hypothetical protein